MNQTQPDAAAVSSHTHRAPCPICSSYKVDYLFVVHGLPVVRCPACGLVSLNRQASKPESETTLMRAAPGMDPQTQSVGLHNQGTDFRDQGTDFRDQDTDFRDQDTDFRDQDTDFRDQYSDSATEQQAAQEIHGILKEMGLVGGRILLVAPPQHPFAAQAGLFGQTIARCFSIRQALECSDLGSGYDAAVVLFQLEKASDPAALLSKIHQALAQDGLLLLTTPSLDNWPQKFFGEQWTEWRAENLYYFDRGTIQALLIRCGFGSIYIEPERRFYTLQHIYERSASFPQTALTRAVNLVYRAAPRMLRGQRVRLGTSGMVVTAQKKPLRSRPLLSVIVPLYNESATFPAMMDALLAKQVEGVDREIIIVESNSKDGSRALAQSYAAHPEVRLVLQDRPRGKGHAVREGFAASRGDILLIQDADLEYDIHDYDILLEPLLNYSALFVLGARHGGKWKMRRFTNQPVLSAYFNSGHLFFTAVINLLYGQHLKDPFTMYKVFRRECLQGLTFECNRFDFDHELVIKLVRKGYTPLEIPVNYRSRSFKEGKKAGVGADPFKWLWTDIKFRFGTVYRRSRK